MRDQARRLRRTMTQTERALWRELRRSRLGWRFRRQFPIPPYIADFACIEAKLIVEVDDGQHAEPGKDDRRDAYLRRKGWRVLRYWNNEVLTNREGVVQAIAEALGPWPSTYPHPNPPPQAGEGVRSTAAGASHPSRKFAGNPPAGGGTTQSPPPLAGEGRVGA